MGLVRLLGVLRLDLDRLLDRLGADQLLEGTRAVLECRFRVVGDLGRNGLEALAHLAKLPDSRIEAILSHLLNLLTHPLELFDHLGPLLDTGCAVNVAYANTPIVHCTINVKGNCAPQQPLWNTVFERRTNRLRKSIAEEVLEDGSLAMLLAKRRASSRVSALAI